MKINKISFSNVNSLKGRHIIDFDQKPISEAGIFAIVGPTGAGKSTILDVITLALYNKVPRFGSVSKTEIEKLGSIITYATNDASAEVTYTVKGITYRSAWSIQKNRNNNWNDYHMELVNVSDQESIFPINRSEVPNKNAKIIGLDFDQFVKSILLCQGDFDQFLKSNTKDRAELIEKITGTTIYRSLGIKAFEKSKVFSENTKQLQLQLSQAKVLTEEEVEALFNQKNLFEIELQNVSKDIEIGLQQESILARSNQLENKIKEHKLAHQEIQIAIKEFSHNEVRLSRHESLISFRPEISEFSRLTLDISRQLAQLNQLQKQETQLREAKLIILKEIKPLLEIDEDNYDVLQRVSQIELAYNTLKNKLDELKQDGTKVRSKINDLVTKANNNDTKGLISISDPNKALQAINDRIKEYNYTITSSQLENTAVSELIELEINLMDSINKETLQRQKVEILQKKIESCAAHESLISQLTERINDITENLIIIETSIQEKNEILKALMNNKGLKLEELRGSLVVGENCPLCGSMIDDLSKIPFLELGQLVLDIDNIEFDIKVITESERTETAKLKEANSKQLSIQALNNSLKEDVRQQGYGSESNLDIANLIKESNEKIRVNSKSLHEIRTAKELKQSIDQLTDAKSLFVELSQIIKSYKDNDKIFNELYKGIEVSIELSKFRNSYTDINNSILQNDTTQKNIRSELKLNEESLSSLSTNLTISLSALDIDSIEFAITLLLDENEYKQLKNHKEILNEKHNNLITLIKKDESDLIELSSDLAKIEVKDLIILKQNLDVQNNRKSQYLLEIGKISQQISANEDEKKLQSIIKQNLEIAVKEGRKWELLKNIIGDAKGSIFSSYAQNLTLNHLIKLANHRLKGFTDRYLIHTPTQDKDLEIIDTYQCNAIRAVKTLSGGETFLISLAMALSLSDLASRNINLECLFIDEGFGTLDAETLDVALDSLETLKNDTGKTIGIISHIEPLKERITTQIVLSKNGQGFSTLNIIPND